MEQEEIILPAIDKHVVIQLGARTWGVAKLQRTVNLNGYTDENNSVESFTMVGGKFGSEAGALHDARVRNNRRQQ